MGYAPAFINAVNFILQPNIEGAGVLSLDPKDKGNWTGGARGKGDLLGTKWGLSAASYPRLDIKGITREQAVAIYYRDYWSRIQGDRLPQRVALVLFDAAVNQGIKPAVSALQSALGIAEDGVCGSQTVSMALAAPDPHSLIADFLAVRALRYADDSDFKNYGKGWMRRCFLACQAAS